MMHGNGVVAKEYRYCMSTAQECESAGVSDIAVAMTPSEDETHEPDESGTTSSVFITAPHFLLLPSAFISCLQVALLL
jgi:hypothetical protein